MADTTEDLAARAVAGDVAAFATLIAQHRPRLAAFCRTLAGPPDGADDLYQETVLRAFQSLDRLASPASFGPWLLGIAANLSKWWARGASRAPYSLDVLTAGGLDPPLAADTQPEYALERAEHAGELLSAIAALPVALRQPLVLHYVEDLSYAEIAAALTLPLSTVKGRLYKPRARLRASLPHPTGVSSTTTAPAPRATVPQPAAAVVDGIHRQLAEWHRAAPPQPFDDAATRVLAAAEARAGDFKHGYFGTEHLLLGLLDVDGLAANVLTQLEITREKAADLLLFAVGPGQKPSPDTLVIVPRAKTVLERAVAEARRLGSPTIGAIHLLLGLLSVRTGIGSLMLESHGLTYEAVRRQLAQLNADTPAAQSPAIPHDLRSNQVVRWAMSLLT